MARKKSKVVKKPVEEEVDEEMASSSSEAEETESENEEMADADGNDDAEDSEEEASGSGSEEEASGSGSEEDEDEESEEEDGKPRPTNPVGSEHCTFDLANLLATNTHQINAAELYSNNKKTAPVNNLEWYGAEPTISASSTNNQLPPFVNEAFLLSKAAEGTTQLLAELWKLPIEKKTDVGLISKLPSFGETKLPRALVSTTWYLTTCMLELIYVVWMYDGLRVFLVTLLFRVVCTLSLDLLISTCILQYNIIYHYIIIIT